MIKAMNRYLILQFLILLTTFILCPQVKAAAYSLPAWEEDQLVGAIHITQSQPNDTLYHMARRFEMGFYELSKANPRVSPYNPIKAYTGISIPSFFILPEAPHQGLVINLPEMRLYYYPKDRNEVITEPIAIGRLGWGTPEVATYVVEKIKDPIWVVPKSIQIDQAEKGKLLPNIMAPGPDNPLGQYALRLGEWTILIHGTNQPSSIGQRISSGCIRMYPEDIEYFYHEVDVKTPVYIVNQPYKTGWYEGHLYFEVHKPLIETAESFEDEQRKAYVLITSSMATKPDTRINWYVVAQALQQHTGLPQRIDQ